MQEYNDDTNLYRADASGVLITKPVPYLVVAHFHVFFAMNDSLTLKITNSVKEIINACYNDTNHNVDKQIQITLSTIVRVLSGQERVLLNIISNNGTSYIYEQTITNVNRIAITKIK